MKSNQTHPVKTRAHNNGVAQSSDVESVRGENKTLRRLVKRITKKAKLAAEKKSQLARSIAELRSKRRHEVVRLNSACIGYRKRIAALESPLAARPTDANDNRSSQTPPSPPPPTTTPRVSSLPAATAAAAKELTNESAVGVGHHPKSGSVVDPHSRTLDQVINKGIQDFLDFEVKVLIPILERRVAERRRHLDEF